MNDKTQKIIFFTTFGCHLCEQAEEMIQHINSHFTAKKNYDFIKFDIIDDEEIMQQYRTTIPVLKNEKTQQELKWPFDFERLCDWLDIE